MEPDDYPDSPGTALDDYSVVLLAIDGFEKVKKVKKKATIKTEDGEDKVCNFLA